MLWFGTQQRNEASMWIAKLESALWIWVTVSAIWKTLTLSSFSHKALHGLQNICDWKTNGKLIQRTYWYLDTHSKNLALVLLCQFLHTDLFACLLCPNLFIWHDQTAARGSSLLLEATQPRCIPVGLPGLESLHRQTCKLTSTLSSQERTCTRPLLFGDRRLPDWQTHWPFQLLETQCYLSASHFPPLSKANSSSSKPHPTSTQVCIGLL